MMIKVTMSNKKELREAILIGHYQKIGEFLVENPGLIRVLMSGLHETGEKTLKRFYDAFQIAVKVFDDERCRDLMRKLMWMLNEESGNNCPNAAMAVAYIAQVRYDFVEPHIPVLQVYADDPSEQIHLPVRKALSIIKNASHKQ